ncbi:MAG: MarR family transcriptional regulator [Cyclobacteriaceae bacterium]|nr:MAG: MarR family transcriptional regulator [Cyclobacteriaceae bacterium]
MRIEEEISQEKFLNQNHKTLVNLLYTHSFLINRMAGFFKSRGITRQQFNVLRILRGQYPNSANLNLIKDRMMDKMSDASRIVERLRLKKLISRKQSRSDRREVEIVISQEGLALLEKMDTEIKEIYKLFDSLSPNELLKLNELLDKFRNGVK